MAAAAVSMVCQLGSRSRGSLPEAMAARGGRISTPASQAVAAALRLAAAALRLAVAATVRLAVATAVRIAVAAAVRIATAAASRLAVVAAVRLTVATAVPFPLPLPCHCHRRHRAIAIAAAMPSPLSPQLLRPLSESGHRCRRHGYMLHYRKCLTHIHALRHVCV